MGLVGYGGKKSSREKKKEAAEYEGRLGKQRTDVSFS